MKANLELLGPGQEYMKWSTEAEAAIEKVPFFVRKRVRGRVEKEANTAGKNSVSLADVRASQTRFISGMSSDVKGYQIDSCFGSGGCTNQANISSDLLEKVEALLIKEDLLTFLKQEVPGDLKYHHNFRITFADCPNACSQPQIKDIGIIGSCTPLLSDADCTLCDACVEACRENAITIDSTIEKPVIDFERCLKCGQCIKACPTGTIAEGGRGFRVQLGGKLGRHPRLARELPSIYSEDDIISIVKYCIEFYKKNSKHGQRFAEILSDTFFQELERLKTDMNQ